MFYNLGLINFNSFTVSATQEFLALAVRCSVFVFLSLGYINFNGGCKLDYKFKMKIMADMAKTKAC